MENEHKYRVVAWWTSGQAGIAKPDSAPNTIHFTAPPQFGGLEGRWTPEDLLMTALASCFTTTFHAIAGCSQFEYTDLAVEAEGTVSKTDNGYCFSEIVIRPCLTIPKEEQRVRAISLLDKAKALCLVSRALAIAQKFEARIEIRKHSYQSEDRGIHVC
jgi:peroxiredoxin-like protein